jgi:hypothetical protein
MIKGDPEFSAGKRAVLKNRFGYNLTNTATNYQNGVDFHVDWAASQFLSKQIFSGVNGYFYD